MDYNFDARCNCLMNNIQVSKESNDAIGKKVVALGLSFDSQTIIDNIARVGNWVGGHVYVSQSHITFVTNAMNAQFQRDSSELIVPIEMIESVKIGKMLMVAKTVDCAVLGTTLRFRCNGAANDKLLEALQSAMVKS